MRKVAIAGCTIVVGALLFFWASKVSFDNSRWLSPEDPAEILKQYGRQHFGQNKELIFAIRLTKPFFTEAVLSALTSLDEQIKQDVSIEGITHPLSLSFLLRDKDNSLNVTNLRKQFYEQNMGLGELKEIFSKSYYMGRYISNDYKSFLLVVKMDTSGSPQAVEARQKRIHDSIISKLNEVDIFRNFKIAGEIKLDHELNTQNLLELKRLIPIIFAFMVVALGLYYVSLKVFLLVVTSAALTLLGSLSTFYLLSIPLNMITSILPLLIMAISISDSIHIIERYAEGKKSSGFTFVQLMSFTWKPCLMTSLTTAMGFLSFYKSGLISIQELSLVAPVAIIFSYLIIVGSNWGLIYLLNPTVKDRSKLFSKIPSLFKVYNNKIIIPACIIFLAVGSTVIYKMAYTETNLLDSFFKNSTKIQQDFHYLDEYHGGTGNFDLIVGRKSQTDFKEIGTYQDFVKFSEMSSTLKSVERMESYLMPVRMVHEKLSSKGMDPDTTDALAQEILFLEFSRSAQEEDILQPFLNFDGSSSRIILRTKNLSNLEAQRAKHEINLVVEQANFKVEYSGNNEYFLRLSNFLLSTQMTSLSATLMAIFVLMVIFYSSRAAMVAVLVNALPICLTMVLIVMTKTPFDFSTVLIASICLSISIDNSIHLINYLSRYQDKPIEQVLSTSLRPVILDSLVFAGVFAIFATSPTVMLQRFGLFSGFMTIVSLILNIVLIPALYRPR